MRSAANTDFKLTNVGVRIMKINKLNTLSTLGLACGLLLVSGSVIAQVVVPFTGPAPLMCTTTNFTVNAITGTNGIFPIPVACDALDPGKGCSVYGYRLSSPTLAKIEHVLFAVSVDQLVYGTAPTGTAILPLGTGDSTTGFLRYARHEYPVRFTTSGATPEARMFIKGNSSPRISTVALKNGSKVESCLIAGPGTVIVGADPFQPITQYEIAVVAGGKCKVTKIFDANGNLADITLGEGSTCVLARPDPILNPLMLGDQPLQNNTSRDGITFGNGTTTCYGPPTPKTPLCICTKAPCPY